MLYRWKYSTLVKGFLLMPKSLISLLLALVAPQMAQAQMAEKPQACPATPAALPAELGSWTAAKPLAAAKDAPALPAATLSIGQAADLALSPTPEMSYVLRPERPAGSVSHGGMAQFTITTAGKYRVAIDSAAWLDVVADGKSLESVGHGRGPDCSGVRKMVDFSLAPGTYLLQIVGNGTSKLRVLVTNTPAA